MIDDTRLRALFVVLVACALVSAPVAVSADADQTVDVLSSHLNVGSEHTTAQDFQNATLTNMSVQGTGSAGYVALNATTSDGSTAGVGTETSAFTQTDRYGVEINPNTALEGVTASAFASTNATTAYITYPNGTVITSTNIQNGDAVLLADLQAGQDYLVVADSNGDTSQFGRDESPSLPATSADLDLTAGVFTNTSTSTGTAYAFQSVTAVLDASPVASADYVGSNHSVGNPDVGWANLTLDNATATITWQEYTGGSWTQVNQTTVSSSGNHTVDISAASSDQVRATVAFTTSSDIATAELHDEGVLFQSFAPALSNGQPTGFQDTANTTLSVQVSDPDFGLPQGDTVTVEFRDDGTLIGTNTTTSNGTVSVPYNSIPGGTHEITATATDEYGNTANTSWTFSTPSQLYIRNETNASELVDTPTEVEVTFFGPDQTYTRTTTTGIVNLTGLPNDEEFIVTAQAQGYETRTIRINSLIQQQNIFLLNEDVSSVDARFVLEDNTGEFPTDTVVNIMKPIELNGTVAYRTIVADEFGVEGVTATLEEGQRYRISIQAPDGTTQVIGPYRADLSETVTIVPGTPTVPIGEMEEGWGANAAIDNDTIEYVYADPDDETSQLEVAVYERGNKSNVLGVNDTYFDLGNASAQRQLTANQTETTWVVEFTITRNGETFTKTVIVSNQQNITPSGLDDVYKVIIGVSVLFLSAGLFSRLNAGVGALVIGIEGAMLWFTGWLPGVTSGIGVAIALFLGVLVNLASRR